MKIPERLKSRAVIAALASIIGAALGASPALSPVLTQAGCVLSGWC